MAMRSIRIALAVSTAVTVSIPAAGRASPPPRAAPCGPDWQLVETPDGGPLGNGLYGVDAVDRDHAWAVGTYFTDRALSLIEGWDGTAWAVESHPEKGDDSFLLSVDAVDVSDVWAVGYYHDHVGQKTLAFHWDGTVWTIVPTPNQGLESALWAVDALGPDDVWAVGFGIPQGGGDTFTLAEHWDGTSWSIVPTPAIDGGASFGSVDIRSSDDGWAVGSARSGQSDSTTLIERWDGSAWTIVPSPNEADADNQLLDVEAISPENAWAVGQWSHSILHPHPLIVSWSGSAWVESPAGASKTSLESVAAVEPRDVWAVGGGFGWTTALQHWNGARWTAGRGPDANRITLHGTVALITNDVWAVGSRIDEDGSVVHAVAEHHCPF
jgi:hypothetical protein